MNLPKQIAAMGVFALFCSASATPALDFGVERVATGLEHPVYVTQAPGDTDILYVLEQRLGSTTTGRISTVNSITGQRETFLTIDGLDNQTGFDDGGLHTMAFHPDFQNNGRFYVSWVDSQANNRVDEFTVQNGSAVMSAEPILSYPALAGRPGRHSIAWVGFRPGATGDEANQLYITTGDGGFAKGNAGYVNVAQDLGTPYGKILRVEVGTGADAYPGDPTRNFGIPSDNPYVGTTGALGEVLHSGLRNPWRVSFDRATDDMYIGDVGWLTIEEIDFIRAGQQGLDFGWSSREGTIETPGGTSPDIGGPQGDSINPIHQYTHSQGVSIAGGYVYRGPIQAIQGDYFFADSFSGRIWTAQFDRDTDSSTFNGMNMTGVTEITTDIRDAADAGTITNIVSFGEDNAGNLYLVKIGNGGAAGSQPNTGELFRLVALEEFPNITDLFVLVDPATGDVQLRNQSGIDISFDAYSLTSKSGSLVPSQWQSLDDLDGPGNDDGGWRESNASPNQLAELLQSGDFLLADGQVIRFQNAFDAIGGTQDLMFEYLLSGAINPVSARVIYASLPENPDFNRDGVVDAADYAVWRDSLGLTGIGLAADGDGNGIVDMDDYQVWRSNFGSLVPRGSANGAASAVPEPASAALWFTISVVAIGLKRWHGQS